MSKTTPNLSYGRLVFAVCFSGAETTTMGTGERQKSNRFRLAKQQLCMCITFFYTIFFAVVVRLQRETS